MGESQEPQAAEPTRLRVLIVDDYPDMALSLRDLLHELLSCPADISIAFDGAQGVALAWSFKPNVILLDIDMPVMNGLQAAQEIRKTALAERTPILVAMTGNTSWLDAIRQESVFDHFLPKPYDIFALGAIIEEAPRW